MGPNSKQQIRRAWRCDCDGVSHTREWQSRRDQYLHVVGRIKADCRELTGHEPPTCPWRAFYDPLVIEALRVLRLSDKGINTLDDAPAVLEDAVSEYLRAKSTVEGHDQREAAKRRLIEQRKREAIQAATHGRR